MEPDILYSILLLLTLGAGAGFLAGLLGIGGGAVLVPGLYYLLVHFGYEAHAMHIAVGTSLLTIVLTGISSGLAHHKRGAVDVSLLKLLLPGIIIGTVLASLVADHLKTDQLKLIFALSQLSFGSYMLLRTHKTAIFASMPKQPWASLVAAANGMLATLMGVGGGVQNVVYMSVCSVPMHRAIGTAAAIGPFLALFGAAGFVLIGWRAEGLPPFSLGYINLIGFLVIISTSVFMAPLGARAAHALPVVKLKRIFSGFMLLLAAKMLSELLL